MNLPRISVEVTERAGGGWDIAIKDDDGALLAGYPMDSIDPGVVGRPMRVPVVPVDRWPAATDDHYPLSSGDTESIRKLLGRLSAESPDDHDARIYGRWLFECLLAPAWPQITSNPAVSAAMGVELALTWPPDQADLHALVWEAMHDGEAELAGPGVRLVVVTRVVADQARPSSGAPDTIKRVPRVLFATGSPLTDPVIRPGAMFMGLLRKFDADGFCVTRAAQNLTVNALVLECRAFRPDVVHLVAHGENQPDGSQVLRMGDDPEPVTADRLLHALRAGGGLPLAVVLCACHSGGGLGLIPPNGEANASTTAEIASWRPAPFAAQLVAGGIPIVTAMAGAISEPACRLFATQMIDAIHKGLPLGRAAAQGRAAALAQTAGPELDWAMPAIFLSPSVPPDFRPLDPTAVNWLIGIAKGLSLSWDPVFIGRQDIFNVVDELFSVGRDGIGFLLIAGEGKLRQLGSTRLLREIGFRLLRAGHIPLLLAEFSEVGIRGVQAGVPRGSRALILQILLQAVEVAFQFGVRPPPLSTLAQADQSFAADDAVTGANLTELRPRDACQQAKRALYRFSISTKELAPMSLLRSPLADDLGELARLVAAGSEATGPSEPFGENSRVVLLADRVHEWTGAIGPLLELCDGYGLGERDAPIPVILTCSADQGEGSKVDDFTRLNEGADGFRKLPLSSLGDAEAALGFQWILLHPWHSEQNYRQVFVASRSTTQAIAQEILSELHGLPANVREALYMVIRTHTYKGGAFLKQDDEKAMQDYLAHPGRPAGRSR